MTPRQLESRIAALRGSVRRLLALHGVSWTLGVVIPLIIAAGLADWLFHLDRVIRAALLACLIGTACWILFKRVLLPLLVPFADLDIALRIEERWPGLNDRLASTIQFLRLDPSDARFGSPAMREATVLQTMAETKDINFREVIDRRPVVRLFAVATGVVAVAAVFVLLAPVSSRIALRRLVDPFGGTAWPQLTHLMVDAENTPLKVARGDVFSLTVKVRPGDTIPASAQATYRFADGDVATEALRSTEGGEFQGRIESVTQPFEFSVTAGDDFDSVRDIPVKVVAPPNIKELAIRLLSPEYTGLSPQTLAPSITQIKALEGTTLELSALANKPLATAQLRKDEEPPQPNLAVDASGTRFKTTLPVAGNFRFQFDLKDTEGFRNRDAVIYDVRGFKDDAPKVAIEEPRADRDVPADATIPFRLVIDDDYGIHSVRIVYRVATGDSEPRSEVAIPLTAPPDKLPPADGYVKHQEISHTWELAPLKLPVGTVITVFADARDFATLSGPNVGRSREIRLRIVSKEDASRQFDDARREFREELARVLTMQKQAITPVDNARRTLAQTSKLTPPERDDLNNAAMIQRQVTSRVNNRDEGLTARLTRMRDDMRNFKIANADAERQMDEMLKRVDNIRDQNLGPAEQSLTFATKRLDSGAENQQGAAARPQPDQPQAGNDAASKNQPPQDAQSKGADASKNQPGADTKSKAADASKNQPGADAKSKAADASKNQPGADSQSKGADASKNQPGQPQPKGDNESVLKPDSNPADGGKANQDDAAKASDAASKAEESKAGQASTKGSPSGSQPKSQPGQPKASPSSPSGQPQPGQDQPAKPSDSQNVQSPSNPNPPGQPQPNKPGEEPVQFALGETKNNQKAIADQLQKMLDNLAEFETYRGVVKDAQDLLKQQEQAMKQTSEAAAKPDLTGKTPDALNPQQKSDLQNLAAKQSQVADGLQKLLERMGDMSNRMNQSDPMAASNLKEAADQTRQKGTSGKLSQAAEQLEKNQMGQARQQQEQARNEIRDLVDSITNRREKELARLIKDLKAAEQELAKTRAQQAENLKKTREAQRNANPQERKESLKRLAKEQAQIQQDLKKQLQRLAKLNAEAAARAGQSASGRMAKAQEQMDEDQGDEAGKQEEEALADLEDAQDELEQTRKDAEEQLANEQLARMGDQLKSLAERQAKIVTDTSGYEAKRKDASGNLTPAQQRGVRGLGQIQSGLKDETVELAEKLDGAPVFSLILRRASSSQEAAAKRLQSIKTDADTEKAARSASDRFKQLIESLRENNANGQQAGQGGGGGGGGEEVVAAAITTASHPPLSSNS